MSGKCLAQLPSPPTTSPTGLGGADFFYPDYGTPWSHAVCKNTLPLPYTTGGRPEYHTGEACCLGAYAGQVSKACLCSFNTCKGDSACAGSVNEPFTADVGCDSCIGNGSCFSAGGKIGERSCLGEGACAGTTGKSVISSSPNESVDLQHD